jgi:hypothetical protein
MSRAERLERIEALRCGPDGKRRLPETEEFVSTETAVKILRVARGTLFAMNTRVRADAIERKTRSLTPGKSGKGIGLLWSRADCERVLEIRRAAKVRFIDACRIAGAIRLGRLQLPCNQTS